MKKQLNINIRIVTIAFLICFITDLIYPIIQTLLVFSFGIELTQPLATFIFWGHSPLIFAGIFISLSKNGNKFIHCFIISLFFKVYIVLMYWHFPILVSVFLYRLVESIMFCAISAWASYSINVMIKKININKINS